MTVNELAVFCGKNKSTVTRWIAKCNESLRSKLQNATKTEPADFTVDEVEAILNASSMSRDAVSILMQNARNNQTLAGNDVSSSLSDKSSSLERAFEMLARAFETIAETQKMQESRLNKIEEHIEERKALLPAPQIKSRDHINMIVRAYVSESGMSYADCWRELYRQFGYRTNTNPKKCAENRGMGILDYIETEGQIETLEAVAMDIYGITNKQKDIARRAGEVTQKTVENYYAIGKAE